MRVRTSSLRFSIEIDGDGLEDRIGIQPGGSAPGSSNDPMLVITYVPWAWIKRLSAP